MDMIISDALLRNSENFVGHGSAESIEFSISPQLRAYFDKSQHAIWSRWNPEPRPCFNPSLLKDIRTYYDFLGQSGGHLRCGEEDCAVEYAVLASDVPGVFNLGGDLELFIKLIETRDRDGLLCYGRACIDVLHRNYTNHGLPLTTISLVQGECLGGGFEAALSGDIIIAERSARFGFPEILFNLFPGMGAYSFLERRVGQRIAEDLITSGKIYSADDMLKLGVVDLMAEDGQGEAEVAALIKCRQRSQNGLAALTMVRRRVHDLDVSELLDIVGIWVDSALRLIPRDIKLMQRLVSRQNGLGDSQQLH